MTKRTQKLSRLFSVALLASAFLFTGCASTKRKPASETSEVDKVQYENYVRKVERQSARLSERLEP